MRAVLCRELGPPEICRLEQLPPPPMGPGQVRIEVHAACVNFPDILTIAGEYQHKPVLPFIPGVECAGVVIEVGEEVEGIAAGDRVMVQLRPGGYADEAVVAPDQLLPLPAGFDFAEGAAFLAANLTAWHALVDRARLAAGEVLLVHGAGGGVGLAAVQLGKLLGATVIACASSETKLSAARERGADHTWLYGAGPFRDAVKRATAGAGANVVFDPVGGAVFEESMRCLAWGARLLVIGFTGGVATVRTNHVLIKGSSVLGVRAGEAGRHDPALRERNRAALLRFANAGRLRPHISHRLPLERWAEAMRLLLERKAVGRVVLLTRS